MKDINIIDQQIVYEGFFDLRLDTLEKKNGSKQDYTILLTKVDAVAILGVTKEKKYILTQEYRLPIGKTLLGCPGGRVEKEESPLQAAQREFLEETGYTAPEFHLVGSYYPLPAICDQKVFFFFAPDAEKRKEVQLDPFESIDLLFLSQQELQNEMKSKNNIDGVLGNILFLTHFPSHFFPQNG